MILKDSEAIKIKRLSQVGTTYSPYLVDLANLLGIPKGVIYLDAKHLYLDYSFFSNSTVKIQSVRNPLMSHILISEEAFAELLIDISANVSIRECLAKLNIVIG